MPLSGGELRSGFLSDVTITYNGFTFSEYTTYRVETNILYDESNISQTEHQTEIVVDSVIPKASIVNLGGRTSDNDSQALKYILSQFGKKLLIQNTGTGAITSEDGDVIDGVRPKRVLVENLGDGQSVRVVWIAEFNHRPTDYTGYSFVRESNIRSVSISSDYVINERQRLSRVTTFVIKSANSLSDAFGLKFKSIGTLYRFFRNSGFNTSLWRQTRIPFSNKNWNMTVSPDRKTAIVTFTENQIDSNEVYPLGVMEIDVRHRTNSSLDKGFRLWTNEFSGTITLGPLNPNQYRYAAWAAYVSLFRRRYELGIQKASTSTGYQGSQSRILWPRVLSIEIEEELYNKSTLSFRVRYDQQVNNLMEVFERTGILQGPQTTESDINWSSSIYKKANGAEPEVVYGDKRYSIDDFEDQSGTPILPNTEGIAPWSKQFSFYSSSSPQGMSTTQATCPPKDDSFKMLKEKWSYASARDIKRHERYKAVSLKNNQSSMSLDYQIHGDQANETDADTDDQFYLVTGTARQQLMYQGAALRFGGPTDPPDIRQHGNKELRLIDEIVDDTIVSSSGCPIHLTKWIKFYEVVGTIDPSVNQVAVMDLAIRPELKQHS